MQEGEGRRKGWILKQSCSTLKPHTLTCTVMSLKESVPLYLHKN